MFAAFALHLDTSLVFTVMLVKYLCKCHVKFMQQGPELLRYGKQVVECHWGNDLFGVCQARTSLWVDALVLTKLAPKMNP